MTVNPTNIINLPLKHMQTLLSNCSNFQTWTGTASAAAAAARIHLYGEVDTEGQRNVTYPVAAIFFGEPNSIRGTKEFGGSGGLYTAEGDMDVLFIADVPAAYAGDDAGDWADRYVNFNNTIGAIIEDALALADTNDGTNQYLNVTGWAKVSGPGRSDKADEEDRLQVAIRFAWSGM